MDLEEIVDDPYERMILGIRDILKANGVREFYWNSSKGILAWNDRDMYGHKLIKNKVNGYSRPFKLYSLMKNGR